MDYSFLREGLLEPESFSQEGKSFLDRMRHPSSYELVQKVKMFVLTFTTMEGLPEAFSSYHQDFLEDVSTLLIAHPQWREEGEKGLKDALEAMERYLLQRLYSTAFYIATSSDSEDDEKFYHRIRTLQFLQPGHFDIMESYNRVAFEMAARELSRLGEDILKSPKEKLQCVLNAVIIMTNLLKREDTDEGTGADDLLPYLIYLILLTSPKHIHSNLRYIRRFRRPSLLTSEEEYYLTHMESAVMFISTVDHTSLSISKEEFESGLNQWTLKVKSGKDVPRRFSTHLPWEESVTTNTTLSATNEMFKDELDESSRDSSPKESREEPHENGPPQLPVKGVPVGFTSAEREVLTTPITATTATKKEPPKPTLSSFINPRFLTTSFEQLTVTDLQQVYQCYQKLCKTIQQEAISKDK